jgi:hypothetical protein
MRKDRASQIEHLKNAVLVVLFFTTILLLYLLWSLDAQGRFHLPDIIPHREAQVVIDVDGAIVPDAIVYGMGDGSFRIRNEKTAGIYRRSLAHLSSMRGDSGVSVTEISEEQYASSIRMYRSLTIDFAYQIPFAELCSHYDMPFSTVMNSIRSFDALAFSDASPESLFIADTQREQYYRIQASDEADLYAAMIESDNFSELPICYTIGDILGGDNRRLMPLMAESSLEPVRWREEGEDASLGMRHALLESLFGENLDFVRRITDHPGNVTYMYGYGQKTLTHQVDGVLEYKNEVSDAKGGGFFGDLKTALTFAAAHGIWNGSDERDIRFTLAEVDAASAGKQEGYRFSFRAKLEENPLYYEEDFPLTIEVLDGQVSYCRSDLIWTERTADSLQTKQAHDPANVIARNYSHIYHTMSGNPLTVDQDVAFQYVVSAVRDIRTGLVRIASDEWLRPAWVVEVEGGRRFYFSLYEALPIGASR